MLSNGFDIDINVPFLKTVFLCDGKFYNIKVEKSKKSVIMVRIFFLLGTL